METVSLSISGMTCGHCVASVRKALEEVPGVHVQNVGIGSAAVHLGAGATTDAVLASVADAGYEATVAGAGEAPAAGGGSCCGSAPDVATLGRRTTT